MIVLVILIVALVWIAGYSYIDWGTHLEMINEYCPSWRWGTFLDFKRMYIRKNWYRIDEFPDSYFSLGSEIHADIISFDGVGMKLDPVSFFIFTVWRKKNAILKRGKNIGGGWE